MPRKRLVDPQFDLWVDMIGAEKVRRELRIHRSTLARWQSGAQVPPVAVVALLRVWAVGLLPGVSDEWYGFRIEGDRLYLPDGGGWYRVREILSWQYQRQANEALQRHCRRLERQLIAAVRAAPRETANDAYATPGDVRSRAFTA